MEPSSRCGWRRLSPEFMRVQVCRANSMSIPPLSSIALTFLALWPIQRSWSRHPNRIGGWRVLQAGCLRFVHPMPEADSGSEKPCWFLEES